MVDFTRLPDLLDGARAHHHDHVGHGESLGLVVGHEDRGKSQTLLECTDFAAHAQTQARIQVREGFVEEDDLRFHDECSRQGNALLLASGQLMRVAVSVLFDPHERQTVSDPLLTFCGGELLVVQAESHVVFHRQVWKERVGLEHHRHGALFGRDRHQGLAVQGDFAFRNVLKSGDHTQGRGLPTAGRSQEGHEFSGLNVEVDAVNSSVLPLLGIVDFGDRAQLECACLRVVFSRHFTTVLVERFSRLIRRLAIIKMMSTRPMRKVQ